MANVIWKYKHARGTETSPLTVSITVDSSHGVIGQNGIGPAKGFPGAAIDPDGGLKAFDGVTFSDFISEAARPGIDPAPDPVRLTIIKSRLPISSITFQPVLSSPTATELDINVLMRAGKTVSATPEMLASLAALLAAGNTQTATAAANTAAAQLAAQQAAASAAAALNGTANAAQFADQRRQNAAQTRNLLNQIKGYRDGTATGQYYVNVGSLTFVNTASGDPVSFAQVPKKYVVTCSGTGVVQHGFSLLGSVVGTLAGSRSIKLGEWVLRAGFVANTAQLALEVFWKNAQNANVSTPLSALLTPDKLSVVGSTVTANGIKTTVTDVLGAWSYVLFELTCDPASTTTITSAEIHLQARGVTLSSDPTLTFLAPTILMDAAVPIDPYTSYPESAGEISAGAGTQANTDAIAATNGRVDTVTASVPGIAQTAAQTAVLTARLATLNAAGAINSITGVNSGMTLPNQRLNGATVAFTATPATFPLPAQLIPNGYRVTITSQSVAQHGFIVGNDGKWAAGRPLQAGDWIDTTDMTAIGAQLDLEIWWRDAANNLISAPTSALLTLAQLRAAGFTATSGGITALVTTVSGRWSHVQFSAAAPANTTNAYVHFRIRAASSLGSVGFELPVILLDSTSQIDPYTVYNETAGGGGVAAPAGTLPRYTGGTPGNVVVLTLSSGANVWQDATTAMRSQLNGPKAIMGSDNYPYPFGAAVPITAGLYPVDTDLMLKTASAAGQPNMEAVPNPYPSNHDPSATFAVLMTGSVSHDGLKILSNAAAQAIYLQPPVGELGEYDFVSAGNGLTLPDLSGAGYPLTVGTVDGTAPVYTARGLQMSGNVTLTTAATTPPTLSLIVGLRRANTSSNHALYSVAGPTGPLWQLGGSGNDQAIWGDVSDSSPVRTSVVNPTAGVNHIYGVTINGTAVTLYDNGALMYTGTVGKPITATSLIKLFTGNGNPFVGEAMYVRILSTALSTTDHQAAYVRANAKMSGRPA